MSEIREGAAVVVTVRKGRGSRTVRGYVTSCEGGKVHVKLHTPGWPIRAFDAADVALYVETPQAASLRRLQSTRDYAEGLQAFILMYPERITVRTNSANSFRSGAPSAWLGERDLSSSAHTLRKRGFVVFGSTYGRHGPWNYLDVTDAGRRYLDELLYSSAPAAAGGADVPRR